MTLSVTMIMINYDHYFAHTYNYDDDGSGGFDVWLIMLLGQ